MLALACLVDKSTHARGAHFWKSYFRMEYNQRRIVLSGIRKMPTRRRTNARRAVLLVWNVATATCKGGHVAQQQHGGQHVTSCGGAVWLWWLAWAIFPRRSQLLLLLPPDVLVWCAGFARSTYIYIYIKCKRQPNCISHCVVVAWRRGAAQADSCICAAILNATASKI